MRNSGLAKIHISVFFFGFAGLFAKFISLPSTVIVLGRVFFAMLFLMILLAFRKQSLKLKKRRDFITLTFQGVVLAIHWWAFFKSIQMSTVATGLLTFSTFPIFVTFLEPLLFNEKLQAKNIVVAMIAFLGIALVIPEFEMSNSTTRGVLWGVVSGLSFAVLSLLNRKYAKNYSSLVIAFYQNISATIILFPFLFVTKPDITLMDILFLALLGIVFTGIAHALFIKGLASVKTHKASIIANLEPVYGILAAILFFGEIPTSGLLIGGIIVMGTALSVTLRKT